MCSLTTVNGQSLNAASFGRKPVLKWSNILMEGFVCNCAVGGLWVGVDGEGRQGGVPGGLLQGRVQGKLTGGP